MNPLNCFGWRLVLCVAVLGGGRQVSAEQEALLYGVPVELCTLENKHISESSGLAASRRHEGMFWTHNDSGDSPRLFCFDRAGKHLGTCKLKDAGAIDWEDMCSFTIDGQPTILVGDIGDNASRRKSCRLYLFDEPAEPNDDVSDFRVIKLRYATGAMDCEAIGVDPQSRSIICVEKRWRLSCRVFEAPYPEPGVNEVVAKQIGILGLPLVTALDISPDGRRAIVLTMGQAFEFSRGPQQTWQQAFAQPSRRIDMPPRKQGESVCYGTNGRDIFLTSEGRPTPLFMVPAKRG